MEFGILGLELAGKSTIFSLLTGTTVQASHGKQGAHLGIAHVPDGRLDVRPAGRASDDAGSLWSKLLTVSRPWSTRV